MGLDEVRCKVRPAILAVSSLGRAETKHPGVALPDRINRYAERLRKAGLRPTRQRLALAQLLFASGNRHVTAESLHEEAAGAGVPVSLATVYNTMHQFTAAGLLRQVTVDGSRTYFDTNIGEHHHFYCEDDGTLLD